MGRGCSAGYCTNSDTKGYEMYRFPQEATRRKVWIDNVNRVDLVIGSQSYLCHVHFSEEMFRKEKTRNGKRRLKSTAVPTIFSNGIIPINAFQEEKNESDIIPLMIDDNTIAEHSSQVEQEKMTIHNDSAYNEILEIEEMHSCEQNIEDKQIPTLLDKNLTSNQDKKIVEFKNLQNRLSKLEKLYGKSERSRIQLMKKLYAANRHIKQLQREVCSNKLKESITKILNEDQINLLSKQYKKMPVWCNDTLMNAFKLRFACGTAGYEEILQQKLPLPSLRTLRRKLQNLKFISGSPIHEVFEFLQIKISSFKDIDKDCTIVLDEMSITPGNFYDTSTNMYVGNVTLVGHDHTQTATHALVIMLAGLCARWKQVVRYDFTGDSVKGVHFKPVIDEIINKAEEIGLRVHSITSDMGAANQAMWREYGIKASRSLEIRNCCTHPVDKNRKLHFSADAVHAFRNIKAGFLNNKIIIIPDKFVKKYSLPSNIAKCQHITDVIDEDKNNDLKLAPKLRKEYLDSTNHFQKMRVKSSSTVINEQVSSALQYLANDDSTDERLTTAWFIDFVSQWFHIMCSRDITIALSNENPEKLQEIINFLEESIELFTNIKVGNDGRWKPFQTAVIISTKTVLDLSKYLLSNGFIFFMPSRITQDCLENLFSVVRLKNVIPNAVQFKNDLKLITISQYMKTICKSNYEEDDRQFLSDFLNILSENRSGNSQFLIKNNDSTTETYEPQICNKNVFINKTE